MNELLDALVLRFARLEAELNQLDAATGDGDHGTTMLKGLRAAANAPDDPGAAFRGAAGGASGTLFSFVIDALAKVMDNSSTLDEALKVAAQKIQQLGAAKLGDKTMLDALLPATKAGGNPKDVAAAAHTGMATTRDLAAKRGRAKYVEGAGVGHIDVGAMSVTQILAIYAKQEAKA